MPEHRDGHSELRALVVEDSDAEAARIERALVRGGFAPVIGRAQSARELRVLLDREAWDVVLSDPAASGLGGLEALRIVRGKDAEIPFILLSRSPDAVATTTVPSGADDYVQAPSLTELAGTVQRELTSAARRRSSTTTDEAGRVLARRLQAISTATDAWLWACDKLGRIRSSSGGGRDLLGYGETDLVAVPCADLIHPEDRAAAEHDYRRCVQHGEGWVGAVRRWRRCDGSYIFLESTGVPDVAEDGTLVGACGTRRDVTARVVAEQRLLLVADRQALVADVSRALAESSHDLDRVIDVAARHVVAMLGDGCWIYLLGEDGAPRLVGGAHPEPRVDRALREAIASGPAPGDEGLIGRAIATGRPVHLSSSDGDLSSQIPPHLRSAVRRAGIRFAVAVPLKQRGTLVGVLALGRSREEDYTDDDIRFLDDLGGHIALGVSNAVAHRRVEASRRERQRLLAQLVDAQEAERRRIAADMHDDAIQAVAALALRLDLLQESLTEPHDVTRVEAIRQVAQEALTRMRTLVFDLYPPELERGGLVAALQRCLEVTTADSGVSWRLVGSLAADLPRPLQVALYRVAQEALANVRKHSRATVVLVRLAAADGVIRLEIEDNGIGIPDSLGHLDPEPGHIGMGTMRERAELVGGTLDITSRPGAGTRVVCCIPEHPRETALR